MGGEAPRMSTAAEHPNAAAAAVVVERGTATGPAR
jgi:hypothetical protein